MPRDRRLLIIRVHVIIINRVSANECHEKAAGAKQERRRKLGKASGDDVVIMGGK